MSAPGAEEYPLTPETGNLEVLLAACQAEAYKSYKYRSGKNIGTGKEICLVDATRTTYVTNFSAERSLNEQTGEYADNNYMLSLSASHTLTDFMPTELDQLVEESENKLPQGQAIFGIEVEYSLDIEISEDGTVEWNERRSYEIMLEDPDNDPEESIYDVAGDEADSSVQKPNYVCYTKELGANTEPPVDKGDEKDTEAVRIKGVFDALMGRAGLVSFEQAYYLAEAAKILAIYQAGEDADFAVENFFPKDVVQHILG